MINGVTSAAQTQPVVQPTPVNQKPTQSKPQPATTTDTVQISSSAQAALTALQEATETPAQTAKEAAGGDHQAQKLLAKAAAAKAAVEGRH